MDVRRIRPEELTALYEFLPGLYRPGTVTRDPSRLGLERLRRETFENPFLQGEGSSWLAWDQDRLVGHLRESPCPAYGYGEAVPCGWWQGFFVLADGSGKHRADAAVQLAMKLAAPPQGHAGLGTPGIDSPAVKLYQRINFRYRGAIPFFYFVVNGAKVLRYLRPFQRHRWIWLGARLASGLYFPGKLLEFRHWRRRRPVSPVHIESWDQFPADAGSLWNSVVKRYALIFDRSTPYLNWRYAESCYERLGVYSQNQLLGWAVCKTTEMKDRKYFGNMRVGTLVDFLTDPHKPSDAEIVLRAALERLVANRADLAVTNTSHRCFTRAASQIGFASGPSNYHFLTKNLPTTELSDCHLTRGDSDGDAHL